VLWRLALMRMERCVRPGDRLCLLGGPRVAVCLGRGAHRLAPGDLGRRLARAVGDQLAVGEMGMGIDIAIGIGVDAGTDDVLPADLAAAAMTSIRLRGGRPSPNGHRPAPFVAVTRVPGRGGVHRLPLRSLVPVQLVDDNLAPTSPLGSEWGPLADEPWSALVTSDLQVLLVDPDAAPLDQHHVVDYVAGIARRAGASAVTYNGSDVDHVLLELQATRPDVVVLTLGAEGDRHAIDIDGSMAWERPARIARAMRDSGIPVIAVSLGASAAALAVCVEQGAVGLFHAELLPQELARQASRRLANGSAQNGHDEPRGPGQLPPPYHALVRLTPSERRVLFQMMEGRTASEIATTLVVSLTTVRSHIRSILRKLNVNSQLAAVALAFGTLTDPPPTD
jgi:DNA-binding NarL/FixJ family response regulator